VRESTSKKQRDFATDRKHAREGETEREASARERRNMQGCETTEMQSACERERAPETEGQREESRRQRKYPRETKNSTE